MSQRRESEMANAFIGLGAVICLALILAAIGIALAGCTKTARASAKSVEVREILDPGTGVVIETITTTVEREASASAPSGSPEPAVANIPNASSNTGGTDQSLADVSWYLFLAGGACILIGVVGLIAAFQPWLSVLNLVPKGVCFMLIGIGVAIIVVPIFIDRYAWLIMAAFVAGVAGVFIYGWKNNWKLFKTPPPAPKSGEAA